MCSDEFRKAVLEFKKFKVIKYGRFFQSLFYFLGYQREQICEEGTNRIWWKKAQKLLNDDLYEKLMTYTPVGPKEGEYKRYQLLNFVEKNIEGYTLEEMEQYSWYLSKLFKWVTTMVEHRKEDILKRREIKEKLKEERQQAETEHAERETLK